MVGNNVNIDLFEFQEKAVLDLLDLTTERNKQTVIVKSPTGSGKTIILISYIDTYLSEINERTAFIWLCPGKGDLEEQSRKKMVKYAPSRKAQTLSEAIHNGFEEGSTTFINWELVTKDINRALTDSEKKNFYNRIAEAHRKNIHFIIVIDEEHSNQTAKAQRIIDVISADHIIRMSATAKKNSRYEYMEIDELDVINSQLITKAIYVNEGISSGDEEDENYDLLLDLADKKRIQILKKYKEIGSAVNPLVLIQFPNAEPKTIEIIEEKLAERGYTYGNGTVSKWLSEDKEDLPDNLTENNSAPFFLLMKQAISTGWDCPRAKILVKLRENMSEDFEVQTVGRIRRMPERTHYDDALLDYCYVYTYDKSWKNDLLASLDKAYETRRLFLKEKCKSFTLEKQLRNLDINMVGEREVLELIYLHFQEKYKITTNQKQNIDLLCNNGYLFGDSIIRQVVQGIFVKTESPVERDAHHITITKKVNTDIHGIYLMHSVDEIKKVVGLSSAKLKAILERLFRTGVNNNKKILSLETKEFYAFIINNSKQLKIEFSEVASKMTQQLAFLGNPKTMTFHIPEQDLYKYDPTVKREILFNSNAYKEYTSGFNTSIIRSNSEQLFEQYCERNDAIDWVYKNGDSGQQYFSIVYVDGLRKQWLFYPDYIVKLNNGDVWVIETKGGEAHGKNKNIDNQIANKFLAFKNYANNHDIKWGFVRDLDNQLYLNNTAFSIDMADEHWAPIEDSF